MSKITRLKISKPEVNTSVAGAVDLRCEDGHVLSRSDKITLIVAALASITLVSAGIAMHILHHRSFAEFSVNAIALIPLSTFISFSTKNIALMLQKGRHELWSGLFSAVLGNFTELSFVIIAVAKRESLVAQTAIAGGILSHTLLILGTCFLCGGLQNHTQSYSLVMARVTSQLLLVSLASLILPTAFKIFSGSDESALIYISRGGAIVLLVLFGCYLYWYYDTHSDLSFGKNTIESLVEPSVYIAAGVASKFDISKENLLELRKISLKNRGNNLPYIAHFAILISSASLVVLCSFFMLEAIDSPSKELGLPKSFVGLVIEPIVIGAAEHVATAIRAHKSRKSEIEWIIEVAIISSIRSSLFVLPVAILLGWIIGVPGITLFFDGFQVTLLTLAILLVNYIIHAGIAHWLEGTMLIGTYVLFANAAWNYPNKV